MEISRAIIDAAIVGFERQKEQIDETIAELNAQLNGNPAKTSTTHSNKRTMSATARKRIAAAQKARWAAYHAGKTGTKTAAPITTNGARPKRILSPAAKKRIAAAQKARWAKFHARKTTAATPPKKAAPRRKLSPAAKAKLVANLAKARAAKAAKAKAATA